MTILFNIILPVFLVIGFGWIASRQGLFSENAVEGVMRFAQNFAIPMVLFRAISQIDLAEGYNIGMMSSFYIGAFACFGLGVFGARYLFSRSGPECVAIGFCAYFSNSLLLAIPIMERAYGSGSLAGNFSILSVHSPLLYTLGITLMEGVRGRGTNASVGRVAVNAAKGILRTPLVIGILAGFAVNLSGLTTPEPVMAAISMMADAALPAALFGLGGVLYRYRPDGDLMTIGMVTGLSLIVHPGIAYLLGRFAFELDTAALRSAVVTAAMAPGVNTYIFANLYGAGRQVAAASVLLGTGLSIFSIWFWLTILP